MKAEAVDCCVQDSTCPWPGAFVNLPLGAGGQLVRHYRLGMGNKFLKDPEAGIKVKLNQQTPITQSVPWTVLKSLSAGGLMSTTSKTARCPRNPTFYAISVLEP